jgi:inner membrane protein involved in colicin E2 resistance
MWVGAQTLGAPSSAVPYAAIFHAALLHPMQHAFAGFALCVFHLLLRLEDSALLLGSIALFLVLACLMYVPRRMNCTT